MNARERAFVVAYTGPCLGNATEAAKAAGYSAKSAYELGSRLLRKVEVAEAIEKAQQKREAAVDATNEELDAICADLAKQPALTPFERLKAINELNRVRGRHTTKVIGPGEGGAHVFVVTGVPEAKP